MRCNKCGFENDDAERFCRSCGHKLRSRLSEFETSERPGARPEDSPLLDMAGEGRPAGSGRHLEALGYALVLLAGVAACVWFGVSWPLYPLAGLVALAAWIRRI